MRCIMKITDLNIHRLYGYINYSISFKENINFLYGENGCGKTTVLKIISNIITGKIYSLYKYKFEKIVLNYIGNDIQNYIELIQNENHIQITMYSEVKGKTEEELVVHNNRFDDEREEQEYYFEKYQVLHKVRHEFNYVFLPLNRTGNFYRYDNTRYLRSLYYREEMYSNTRNENNIDMSIVNDLIKRAINTMNMKLSDINSRFNSDILRSFLDAENISNSEDILNYLHKINDGSINLEDIKKQYKKALKSINLADEQSEKKLDTFFENLYSDIEDFKNNNTGIDINLLFKLSEFKKITNIISKAEENDRLKSKVKLPVENFTKTINHFFSGGFNEKRIAIHPNGMLFIKNYYGKKITLDDLSSGEKQIITFFAYLVFGLEDTNQSIYLVDEPELSLHLNWQRIFVESIMNLNMDVQLIFATHSPEIIGKYRENAIKLIPSIEGKTNE